MPLSVLRTMEPGSDGWRRYLGLALDGLFSGSPSPLPPVVPLLPLPVRDNVPFETTLSVPA